jgi:hypothetical protein
MGDGRWEIVMATMTSIFSSSGNPEFNSNGQYHWDDDDDAKQ